MQINGSDSCNQPTNPEVALGRPVGEGGRENVGEGGWGSGNNSVNLGSRLDTCTHYVSIYTLYMYEAMDQ